MGGIGITVRVRPREGADPAPPLELHRAIWDRLLGEIWRHMGRNDSRAVVQNYLLEAAGDGYHDHLWTADDGALHYVFKDYAGCCGMSSEAAWHWTELALALDRPRIAEIAATRGYELVAPTRSVGAILRSGASPAFVYIDNQTMFGVSRARAGVPLHDDALWGDDGSTPPKLSSLPASEREKVERVAITGRCHCELCSHARKTLSKKRKGVPAFDDKTLDGNVLRAWELLTTDARGGELATTAAADVSAFDDAQWAASPLGPPAFQVLRDWLGARDAPVSPLALTGMLATLARAR